MLSFILCECVCVPVNRGQRPISHDGDFLHPHRDDNQPRPSSLIHHCIYVPKACTHITNDQISKHHRWQTHFTGHPLTYIPHVTQRHRRKRVTGNTEIRENREKLCATEHDVLTKSQSTLSGFQIALGCSEVDKGLSVIS